MGAPLKIASMMGSKVRSVSAQDSEKLNTKSQNSIHACTSGVSFKSVYLRFLKVCSTGHALLAKIMIS